MKSSVIILVLLSLCISVHSHGRLTSPLSRGKHAGKANYLEEAPVSSANGADFICRNDAPVDPSLYLDLTAGGTMQVSWNFPAAHVGDCFVYFTYDAELPDAQKMWFKVAQWDKCELKQNALQTFTIPAYLPSSTHIIVRWEWYALHVRANGIIEFYCQCIDARITGATPGELPEPKVKIPGHLPSTASIYRDGYATAFWFTGPPVATIGGGTYSTGQYTYTSGGTPVSPPPSPTPSPTPTPPPPAGTVTTGVQTPPADVTTSIADSVEAAANDEELFAGRTPCEKNEDCANGVCLLDRYCLGKGMGKTGLNAGGVAALVFAGLIIVAVVAAALFFYLNRKEVPYMVPFKGRI